MDEIKLTSSVRIGLSSGFMKPSEPRVITEHLPTRGSIRMDILSPALLPYQTESCGEMEKEETVYQKLGTVSQSL